MKSSGAAAAAGEEGRRKVFSGAGEREREREKECVCYFSSSWFELAGEFLVKYQIAVNIQDIWNFHVKWIAVRRLRI